jgi:hypothetical protein
VHASIHPYTDAVEDNRENATSSLPPLFPPSHPPSHPLLPSYVHVILHAYTDAVEDNREEATALVESLRAAAGLEGVVDKLVKLNEAVPVRGGEGGGKPAYLCGCVWVWMCIYLVCVECISFGCIVMWVGVFFCGGWGWVGWDAVCCVWRLLVVFVSECGVYWLCLWVSVEFIGCVCG